jgi:hypothetical protein
MEMQRKALYNSLRQNWLNDKKLPVESWQVEDYRKLSNNELFEILENYEISLNRNSFTPFGEKYQSPEELSDDLFDDIEDISGQDEGYLVVFELWRRLLPHVSCISVFCDEVDYQIFLYDQGQVKFQELQDALANLQDILEDNADEGGTPSEIFSFVSSHCANNLESFLFDYISDLLSGQDTVHASELCDGFYDYVDDKKWFDLLKAKSLEAQDPESTHRMIFELIEDSKLSEDKDFLLEVLYLLTQSSNQELFVLTLKKIMPQIIVEEEFRDILESCQEFFQFSDLEESEQLVCKILKKRDKLDLEKDINPQDSDLKELIDIVQRPYSLS